MCLVEKKRSADRGRIIGAAIGSKGAAGMAEVGRGGIGEMTNTDGRDFLLKPNWEDYLSTNSPAAKKQKLSWRRRHRRARGTSNGLGRNIL